MEGNNIIRVNVANFITIAIMGTLGMLAMAAVLKYVQQARGNG